MISGMGGAMGAMRGMGGGMPNLEAMKQAQQRAFSKADGNGSGGLDATEFDSLMKDSPMAKMGGGVDSAKAFAKMDGDGNGELSAQEMESAQKQMMERFQSTLSQFGGGAIAQGTDPLQTLLQSMNSQQSEGKDDDETTLQGLQGASQQDLTAQLQELIQRITSTYSSSFDGTEALRAVA
jgi:Ca2+-binding EF-hand superfamily protein